MTHVDVLIPFFLPFIRTFAIDMPMRVYSILQTIGKRKPGGARAGLFILSYISMLFIVRSADSPPTARVIRILHTYVFVFDFNIITSKLFYAIQKANIPLGTFFVVL